MKIPVEETKVKIKVDFGTVWAFMWRWILIVLLMYIPLMLLMAIGGTL